MKVGGYLWHFTSVVLLVLGFTVTCTDDAFASSPVNSETILLQSPAPSVKCMILVFSPAS
jgi:hypothetical protein